MWPAPRTIIGAVVMLGLCTATEVSSAQPASNVQVAATDPLRLNTLEEQFRQLPEADTAHELAVEYLARERWLDACRHAHFAVMMLDKRPRSASSQLVLAADATWREANTHCAIIEVNTTPSQATVTIDGHRPTDLAASHPPPLRDGPHFVLPGRYAIRVSASGYHTARRRVEMATAERATVEVRLIPFYEKSGPYDGPGKQIGGYVYPYFWHGIAGTVVGATLLVGSSPTLAVGFQHNGSDELKLLGLGLLTAGGNVLGLGFAGLFWADPDAKAADRPRTTITAGPGFIGAVVRW